MHSVKACNVSLYRKMSSLVERLRDRSDRRPVYNIDDSDDDDFVSRKSAGKIEKIERDDVVCVHYFLYSPYSLLLSVIINAYLLVEHFKST